MSDYKVLGTYITKEMYESKAFLSLTGIAPQLLILFLGKRYIVTRKVKKRKIPSCLNCDNIVFTYIEAKEKFGISMRRFTKGIDELLARGFIKIKRSGGAYEKDKAVYSMSDQWCLWHPGMVFEIRRKVTVQKGFLNNPKAKAKSEATRALKRKQHT